MRGAATTLAMLLASLTPVAGWATAASIDEIRVVGARLPRPVQDVLGSVDVIHREALVSQVALRTEDLVRYTPGISVVRADNRFGATELTIRGLSGNRIMTLVDGVPVADQFDVGAFANAGQDYLVSDSISRIEVLRGPASTLFGSDALGGVVAVLTRDPGEYLQGESIHRSVGLAYSGADHSRRLTSALAAGGERTSAVLHAAARHGDETDAAGSSGEDPIDRKRYAAMFKLEHALDNGDVLRLKLEGFDEQVDVESRALLGYSRQFRNTTALSGDDRRRRQALSAEYAFGVDEAWADNGRLLLHGQRTRVDQRSDERRDRLAPPVAIHRRFDYAVDDLGAVLDLESTFTGGALRHRLGWGLSVRHTEVEEYRDGHLTVLPDGERTNVLLGETMPVRDFPRTRIVELGAYLHDEIGLGDWTLIPALRLESHRLDARADLRYGANRPIEDVHVTALAPKLGVQWHATSELRLFAQYARGFRAPPFEDVNIGLEIPQFNVRAIPNPDLEAETSDGLELGLRYHGARIRSELVLFGADYDDFIESKVALGPDPETGVLLFQSRNRDRARVYGVEFSVDTELSPHWRLHAAANWTRGEDRERNQPLNTVDPATLVTQLHWQPRPAWTLSLAMTTTAAKTRVDDSSGPLFQPGAHTLFDLFMGYRPLPAVRFNLGLFNLGDRRYRPWPAVRGRTPDDPMVDLLAAPGRHAALSASVRF